MKLSNYPPIRNKQLKLLETLQAAHKEPSRENMKEFFCAASDATRSGNGLVLEEIEDIFNKVYNQT